jgi:outer membrane protein assembly factor BamB
MFRRSRPSSLAFVAAIIALAAARVSIGQVIANQVDSDSSAPTDKSPAFSVHKEQRPILDAFEDFERYRDKNSWEKAFTALGKIEDGKPGRLVPADDGFLIPTDLHIRAELLSLPPQGREAYRLFNDAKAAQALRDATAGDNSQDEITSLSKIVNRYFVTSIGDKAADRLGDALFESGDFANANRCWEMIVDNFPDSSLSTVQLQTKRAIALARAGEWDQFEMVNTLLHDRYRGQKARIAGQDVVASNFIDSPHNNQPATQCAADTTDTAGFATQLPESTGLIPASDQPAWQIPIMDTDFSNQLIQALTPNGWQGMATQFTGAVPATATDTHRIYVNWLGICFACDLHTGKLLWRTDSFGDMPKKMAQSCMQGTSIDPKMYSTSIVGENVLFTRRSTDNEDYNQMPMNRLLCVTGAAGKAVWKSESGPLSGWGIVGYPLVAGDVFYAVAHAQGSPDLVLICAGLARGELRWKAELGTPATSVNWRGQPTVPTPTLLVHAGKIYVLTNNGALLQVDGTSHQVDWAFSYPTYVEQQQQYWYGYQQTAPVVSPGTIVFAGNTLCFKECNNALLFAIDPSGPSIKWKRRIDSEAGLVRSDGKNIFLAGPEVECLDAATRTLQWDVRTGMNTPAARPVISGDWIYLFGSKGIDRIGLANGATAPRFRGYDRDCDGGAIWKTPDRLVTVSSRAITAYAIGPAGKGTP